MLSSEISNFKARSVSFFWIPKDSRISFVSSNSRNVYFSWSSFLELGTFSSNQYFRIESGLYFLIAIIWRYFLISRIPCVLSAFPAQFEEENETQGGEPIITSTSGTITSTSVTLILSISPSLSSQQSMPMCLQLGWLSLCVSLAGPQWSKAKTILNPACLNPSENPPAPQNKSATVSLFFIKDPPIWIAIYSIVF